MEAHKDKKFASQEIFDLFFNHLDERRVNKIKMLIEVNKMATKLASNELGIGERGYYCRREARTLVASGTCNFLYERIWNEFFARSR